MSDGSIKQATVLPADPTPDPPGGMDARPERRSIARALSWTSLESFGLSGLSFLTLLVLAHYLTPSDFGLASMTLGIVQVLNIPVEMLFHDALVQRPTTSRIHFDTAFTASALLGFALCALCWMSSDMVARALGAPAIRSLLPWMSMSLPMMGLGSAIIAYQRRYLKYRPLAIRSLVGRIAGAIAGIGVAVDGGGAWSLVVQQVASVTLATAALWIGCDWRPRIRWSPTDLKDLLSFGVPAMSVMALYFVGQRWFMLLVGSQLGAAAAGYFNLAFRAVDSLRDVTAGAVSQLALPVFARYQREPGSLQSSFQKATGMTCALMFPVFGSLAVCATPFVHLLFRPAWYSATALISLMSLLTWHYFSRMFAAPLMSAVRKPHYPVPGQFTQLVLVTVAMLGFGYQSVMIASMIWAARLAISTPLDIWFLRKATGLGLSAQLGCVMPALLSAIVMVVVEWQMQNTLSVLLPSAVTLALTVGSGVTAYFALLYCFDAALCKELVAFGHLAIPRRRLSAPGQASD